MPQNITPPHHIAGFPLEALIDHITIPIAVVNQQGQVILANKTGQARLAQLFFVWEPLPPAQPTLSGPHKAGLLVNSVCPSYVACEQGCLKVTPFHPSPDEETIYGLLEWLPENKNEQRQILQEVSRAVNSSLILEDIFESLGDVLHQHIPYKEASIVILDDSQNGIKILVRLFEDGDLEISRENNTFAGYDPVVEKVLRHPAPMLYARQAFQSSLVFSTDEFSSALITPLINKGVVIGLVAMATEAEAGFQYYQQELLTQVSEQIAVAVENAKFYWQTQAQASREFLINQLTNAIRQSLDIDTILKTAVQELGKVLGVSRCYIEYFPAAETEVSDLPLDLQDKTAVSPIQTYGYRIPGVPEIQPELTPDGSADWPFAYRVFQARKQQDATHVLNPFVLNDYRDCPPNLGDSGFFEANAIQSVAIFPILVKQQLVGTITLQQCDTFRVWLSEDIDLMNAIAEHLGVALNQAQLFEALDAQKRELENALEELQQAQVHLIQSEKMAMLGQFVAGIAHEVNTPLGTMASNNATLRSCVEKLKQQDPPPEEKVMKAMSSLLDLNKLASERIQEIVKNLRNFARLDESEMKVVDVHENLDSTLLLVEHSIPHHIKVVKDYGQDIPQVQCFPGLLNQVFMNLIVNATHAMAEKNKGTITLTTQHLPDTQQLVVTVTDTGKGILTEHRAKIFDPGFTTKGVGVGTGLGLALCFKIVEKHHGKIEMESTVDVGTAFTVTLPVRQTGLAI
ncbi:MAG: GAF domain-containing protein [Vampirovibrio sp.]|nr:GAF domain-containing protein [Vampirovibrio sp.]